MSLFTYEYMDWSNEGQRKQFLLAHQIEHHKLAQAAIDHGFAASAYPLGDIGNMKDWLRQNQQMHAQLADNLSIDAPPDLEEWDLEDAEQASEWLLAHIGDHDRLALSYGVA